MRILTADVSKIIVEKDGKYWERMYRDGSYIKGSLPSQPACECCVINEYHPVPKNDGANPPTEEEWLDILEEGIEMGKAWSREMEEYEKRRVEEERKETVRQEERKNKRAAVERREYRVVIKLLEQLRYADAKEHCRIHCLDYDSLVNQLRN